MMGLVVDVNASAAKAPITQGSALVVIGEENVRNNHFPNSNRKWHKNVRMYVKQIKTYLWCINPLDLVLLPDLACSSALNQRAFWLWKKSSLPSHDTSEQYFEQNGKTGV